MRHHVTDYLLYRWRNVIGYILMAAVIIGTILVAFLYVPGELRQAEMDSSVQSASLSFKYIEPRMVIDLPYHVLQRVIINLFGVSTATIKLPSVLLALATSLGFFLLVRTWFRTNVAIFATLLASTSTQFIFLAQDGTPAIMYSFLATWLLFAATMVSRRKLFGTFWKVMVGALMAMLLYSPLGIYILIAVITTALFHPHIRYIIRRLQLSNVVLAVILGVAAILPVLYAAAIDHSTALTLLGIPTGDVTFRANALTVLNDLFGFSIPSNGAVLRPYYSLGAFLLIAVGTYTLLTQKYTARSYVVIVWGLLLAPFILLEPTHISALFVIASLLLALGIATLIANWYKLFPSNPYARVTGLVPLSIVVFGIVASGMLRFFDSYQYNADALTHYSKDLQLLDRELSKLSSSNTTPARLFSAREELPFYAMVAKYDRRVTIETTKENPKGTIIVTRARRSTMAIETAPSDIITSTRAADADRFYIYK